MQVSIHAPVRGATLRRVPRGVPEMTLKKGDVYEIYSMSKDEFCIGVFIEYDSDLEWGLFDVGDPLQQWYIHRDNFVKIGEL